jgi:ribosomal protein S18 acetylase RimI-like enzyme
VAVKVRRYDGRLGPRARVRPWSFDDRVVQVSLADQAIVPSTDEVRGWVDTLATGDVEAIRTGALFPDAADSFIAAGFTVIDTLALLRADLSGLPRHPARAGTVRLSTRRLAEASAVDRAAFGDPWGNESRDLADIRRATPVHRGRARLAGALDGRQRPLVAFAISGAASGQGYLQRLAVAPAHQRQGHGRALVADALSWMVRRRLTHALVNTAVANEPALRLYESQGFRRLPEQLRVMQFDLDAP